MRPDIKAKWLTALRSGEYEQATRWLKNDGGFCCLGVLCDVHRKETEQGQWTALGAYEANGARSQMHLPDPVKNWAGLESSFGDKVIIDGKDAPLSDHNDSGRTFAEIADAIEREL